MTDSPEKIARKQYLLAVIGVVLFVGLLVAGMWISDPNKGKLTPLEIMKLEAQEVRENYKSRNNSTVTDKEQWIAKSEEELTRYKLENRTLKQSIHSLEKRFKEFENSSKKDGNKGNKIDIPVSSSPAFSSITPVKGSLPPPPTRKDINVLPPGNKDISIKKTIAGNILPPSPAAVAAEKNPRGSTIQVFEFESSDVRSKKGKKPKNISHYLPSGAFVKVVLLSGVDAPTGGEADNNPVPILMRLLDHGTLPNYFDSEVRDCHVTGDVRGDLASERGKIRLERLSCVLINGDVVEVKLKGWVNGEDGKEGFRGRVVEKAGAILAKTFVAGTFAGIGESASTSYETLTTGTLGAVTTINPSDVGKAGIASGTANSMSRLADYYMRRANEMYPIIEISAQRIGELVLSEGVDLGKNVIGNMGGKR